MKVAAATAGAAVVGTTISTFSDSQVSMLFRKEHSVVSFVRNEEQWCQVYVCLIFYRLFEWWSHLWVTQFALSHSLTLSCLATYQVTGHVAVRFVLFSIVRTIKLLIVVMKKHGSNNFWKHIQANFYYFTCLNWLRYNWLKSHDIIMILKIKICSFVF